MPGTLPSRGNILYSWMVGPTFTPVAVSANTTAEQSLPLPGLQMGDFVDVCYSGVQTAGIGIVNCRVSTANTLQIGFSNSTAGSLTPGSGIYQVTINRPESFPLPTTAA